MIIPSLERIQSYLEIEHEEKPTEAGIPPAAWPKSGELQVEHLSARYSAVRQSRYLNTLKLISVCRLVQRYYTIFPFMSNQVKGLELVNQALMLYDMFGELTVDLLCFSW